MVFSRFYFFVIQGFMSLPFYFAGYVYKDIINKFVKCSSSNSLLLLALGCFLLNFFFTSINGRVSIYGHKFGNLYIPLNILVFYLNGFLGSSGVFFLSSIVKVNETIAKRLADSLISVVGFQALFVYSYEYIFGFGQPFVISAIATVCIFVFCLLCHFLVMHICPQLLGKRSK